PPDQLYTLSLHDALPIYVTDDGAVRKLRKSTPVVYEVFDLLYLDGTDLTKRPLRDRQRLLDDALTPMGSIRRSEGFVGTGVALRSEEHTSELQSRGHLVC